MTDSGINKNDGVKKTDNKINSSAGGEIKDQPKKQESKISDAVVNAVHGDTGAVKDILDQAKKSTGDVAGKAYDIAAEKATSKIVEQKTNLAQGLSSIADNIRQMGESLRGEEDPHGVAKFTADYGDTLAEKVEQVSGYLDKRDLGALVNDIEGFAHRNPVLFLGAAFALGIGAARFLKSGNANQALMRRPRYERKGQFLPDEHEGVHLPEDLDKQANPTVNQAKSETVNKSANAASPNKGA